MFHAGRAILPGTWRPPRGRGASDARTQQQPVPPQVPQVGHVGGETGRRASIRRPMLVASVAEAKCQAGAFCIGVPRVWQ
eukprot:COSAG06_NODE_5166_length_3667_cov_2.046525_3_plen_80_part_00